MFLVQGFTDFPATAMFEIFPNVIQISLSSHYSSCHNYRATFYPVLSLGVQNEVLHYKFSAGAMHSTKLCVFNNCFMAIHVVHIGPSRACEAASVPAWTSQDF